MRLVACHMGGEVDESSCVRSSPDLRLRGFRSEGDGNAWFDVAAVADADRRACSRSWRIMVCGSGIESQSTDHIELFGR
jgi:hypothetical protein